MSNEKKIVHEQDPRDINATLCGIRMVSIPSGEEALWGNLHTTCKKCVTTHKKVKDQLEKIAADREAVNAKKRGPRKEPLTTIPSAITIAIGSHSVTYLLFKTTAPQRYDGFGTMTVYDNGTGTRYVLIDAKHLEWQKGRNGSGLHVTDPCDSISQRDLENRFSEVIRKGFGVES